MRVLLALGLATYWAAHPHLVQRILALVTLAASALTHLGGGHAGGPDVQTTAVLLGSHWN
jgi:hypothetical protein